MVGTASEKINPGGAFRHSNKFFFLREGRFMTHKGTPFLKRTAAKAVLPNYKEKTLFAREKQGFFLVSENV